MEYELSVIEKMGFAGYFLIVQDYITGQNPKVFQWAWTRQCCRFLSSLPDRYN